MGRHYVGAIAPLDDADVEGGAALEVGEGIDGQDPVTQLGDGAAPLLRLVARVGSLAGEIEVFLKDYVTDKTNWQRMLKN